MRLAEALSDLTSLRASPPGAALALVSARPRPNASQEAQPADQLQREDPDLQRARDLIALHYVFKPGKAGGGGGSVDVAGLADAREGVRRAVGGMKAGKGEGKVDGAEEEEAWAEDWS
ncbi:hypothetical protein EJ06DRAFT_556782 [Trichodelitschia bisporula]|uniref:Uncharacterized protein n=1 Tax=Trichodelitschia bisporula TaxID=703511 RepID=A0A6G1HX45_9PEZI|nr:hypothetical protein EJ06DRAFT_556782 [Trichodelitschia bisporula]